MANRQFTDQDLAFLKNGIGPSDNITSGVMIAYQEGDEALDYANQMSDKLTKAGYAPLITGLGAPDGAGGPYTYNPSHDFGYHVMSTYNTTPYPGEKAYVMCTVFVCSQH